MRFLHSISILKNRSPFVILLFILLGSCNSESKNTNDGETMLSDNYSEFQTFDLTSHDIPAILMLPDETADIGTSTKPEIQHTEDNFYWDIHVGPNFKMHIEDYGDNKDLVTNHKKMLASNKIFEIDYIIETNDLIMYKQKLIVKGDKNASKKVGIEHVSYHVYAQKNINDINYELRSGDGGSEKRIIELMAKSIRSLKAKR